MALGAMTAASSVGHDGSPLWVFQLSVVGDGAYPTGGSTGFEALVRDALGKGNIDILGVVQQNPSDHVARYDRANDTLVVQLLSTGAEAANAADLSGTTFDLLIFAR